MISIVVNSEARVVAESSTIQSLLTALGRDARKCAVELNLQVVPRADHATTLLKPGDTLEIVTLVGGGSGPPGDSPLKVGPFTFQSRLFTGTGKYSSYDLMRQCMVASECDVTTVAVRRERLIDKDGHSILDFLDLDKLTILPNTAGCFSADEAIRHARLARELLGNLGNPGANWVKLECLADTKTLLPDPIDTLKATETLVNDGFTVLVYSSDDPILAKRLKALGAASVMPAGSPIGSGQGILNPGNIRIILEYLKDGDPDYPRDRRCGRGDGKRRQRGDGTRLRWRVIEYRHRQCERSTANGLCDEAGLRGWSIGVPRGANPQKEIRKREQPLGRVNNLSRACSDDFAWSVSQGVVVRLAPDPKSRKRPDRLRHADLLIAILGHQFLLIFMQLVVKRFQADTEFFRGPLLIARVLLIDLEDKFHFHIGE
jgi:thiazole synthase